MRAVLLIFLGFFLFPNCDSTNSTVDEPEFRISGIQYSLGLTHNSHLNRSYSTPESAYSATITFEVYLTEETDYTQIHQFAIVDDANEGWVFDAAEIQEAYSSDTNSLIFQDLQLRIFDFLNGKIVSARFLDENGEIIRERAVTLDNDFPLPALTDIEQQANNDLVFTVDFYSTPYDGGNLPFPVTIYNTFFSSNSFSLVWVDSNNDVVREDFVGTSSLNDEGSNVYTLNIAADTIPGNATKVYSTFRRGRFTRGGVLYTRLIPLQ